MRGFLFVATYFIAFGLAYCQEVPAWTVGASTGWSRSSVSDLLLNHYKYSGNSFLNFSVNASRNKIEQNLTFQFTFNKVKLYPDNFNELLYEYNYLEQLQGEIAISYLYAMLKSSKNISISIGGANTSFYFVQDEFHRNLLYPYGLDHSKSYVLSPLNLMPLLAVDFTSGKNSLNSVFGYSIANISARPDDNYVKQIEIENGKKWRGYFPGSFTNFRYSVRYQYTQEKFIITLAYEMDYLSIDRLNRYKSLQRMLLAGINIPL